MFCSTRRVVGLALLLAGCGTVPADFGITGPSPGQSLTPAAPVNPDATAVIPGVRTGDALAPSVQVVPATPGSFYGAD